MAMLGMCLDFVKDISSPAHLPGYLGKKIPSDLSRDRGVGGR